MLPPSALVFMWARLLNICLGIWLMAASGVLGYAGAAHTNDVIVGALVASFACIAIWEVTRPVRWANVALGAWVVVAGWLLGFDGTAVINGGIVGVLVVACALVRGEVKEQFGGGWSALYGSEEDEQERANKA